MPGPRPETPGTRGFLLFNGCDGSIIIYGISILLNVMLGKFKHAVVKKNNSHKVNEMYTNHFNQNY